MRIQQLHIDGFGHFADYSTEPLKGDIVIFHGANEAGKSTLLSFVQSVLFGFQTRRPGLPAIDPLRGGNHGGRVIVVDENSSQYTIERHAGGPVTISYPDGSTGDASDLNQLLGLPAEVYCNVFSFDLKQLFEAGSLNDRSITTHLFGAGLGTENLLSILGNLDGQANDIFLSNRGRVQRVPQLLDQLQAIENKLLVVQQDAEKYHGHRKRLGEIETLRAEIRRQIETVRQQQKHDDNLLSSLDDWSTLRAVDARITALPEIDTFPEDGVTRLDEIETRIVSAETEERRVRQTVKDLRSDLESPLADAVLNDHQVNIELLRSQLESFTSAIGSLQQISAEATTAAQTLQDGLATLGPGWDADRLAAFDTSIPEQDTVASHNDALERADQALREAERDVQSATEELQIVETRLEGHRRQLDAPHVLARDHAELATWEEIYREARSARQEYGKRWQQYRDQQSSAPGRTPAPQSTQPARSVLAGGMILAGVVLVLAGILAGGTAMVIGAIAGGLTIVAGLLLLLSGSRQPVQSPAAPPATHQTQAEYEASRQRLVNALKPLGSTDPDGADALLESTADRISRTRTVLNQIDVATADVTMRRQRLDAAIGRRDVAGTARDEAGSDWHDWLTARELPDDLSPGGMTTIFTSVTRLRQQQDGLNALEGQRRELAGRITEYRKRYESVIEALGERPAGSIHEVGAAANLIVERYDSLRDEQTRRQTRNEQLQTAQRDHAERLEELDRLRQQRTDLLARGSTDDPETFRTRARQFAERQAAIQTRDETLARIQRLSGPGDAWNRFRDELNDTSVEILEQRRSERAERIEGYEEELSRLDREHGERLSETKRLAGDETAARLRAEQLLVQEQLREAAEEWSTYTIAHSILDRARQRYEEERQPEVIRTAERYFRSITGGRYTGLVKPIGSDDVQAVLPNDQRLDVNQLSRGTREQLYLSLRFGLIEGFSKTSPLPVIVDDILVNFDPARARATAEAFTELSGTNQVIIFTCHPSTIDHFQHASPNVQVVELGREAAVPLT